MSRQLQLRPAPRADEATSLVSGREVYSPNPRAARALGVPSQTLEAIARAHLPSLGLAVAAPLAAQRALRQACEGLSYADPAAAARRFRTVLSEVFRAGIDLAAMSCAPSSRAAEVANLAIAYQTRLRQGGLVDPAEVLWEAARRPPAQRPLLLYGYPRLGADEGAFVEAIAGEGSLVLLPYGPHPNYQDNALSAASFETRGWEIARHEVAPGEDGRHGPLSGHPIAPALALTCEVYADQEAEVRGALARIKALLADGCRPEDIVLIARDDAAYGPLVLAVAWEYGVPVHAFYSVPLAQTRLGAWLMQALEAIETGLAFEPTYRLLNQSLSPFLEADVREQARQTHPSGLEAWRSLGCDLTAMAWPAATSRAQWAQRVQALLEAHEVGRHVASWPCERVAYQTLSAALVDLAAPAPEVLSRARFADELRDALNLYQTPAHPEQRGVELHTPLALYGARYRHVVVLGLAEDHLPARITDDPVLDFLARKQLAGLGFALEGAAAAARREFLSFGELVATAGETLACSYPRRIGTRAALPSPYFGWLGARPEPPAGKPAASLEEARRIWLNHDEHDADPLLTRIAAALDVERRREEQTSAGHRDPHDGFLGQPVPFASRTFSATQLAMLGQCAFRWLIERGMGVAEPEELDEELSPSLRGDLFHKTLELGVNRCTGAPDLREALLGMLDEVFAEAEHLLEIPSLPAWDARRAEYLRTLRRAIQKPDFLDAGARVEATEVAFAGSWRGFKVVGKIDRLDATPAGLVVVDYKAGSSVYGKAQDADGIARVDLQLPIYLEVALPHLRPGEGAAGAYYYLIGKGKREGADLDAAALDELAARLKAYFDQGHFPVRPDRKQEACTYCANALICRRGPRLARKGIL